jgi:hypothetical protein
MAQRMITETLGCYGAPKFPQSRLRADNSKKRWRQTWLGDQ